MRPATKSAARAAACALTTNPSWAMGALANLRSSEFGIHALLYALARQLSEGPRKTLGFQMPAEMFS